MASCSGSDDYSFDTAAVTGVPQDNSVYCLVVRGSLFGLSKLDMQPVHVGRHDGCHDSTLGLWHQPHSSKLSLNTLTVSGDCQLLLPQVLLMGADPCVAHNPAGDVLVAHRR